MKIETKQCLTVKTIHHVELGRRLIMTIGESPEDAHPFVMHQGSRALAYTRPEAAAIAAAVITVLISTGCYADEDAMIAARNALTEIAENRQEVETPEQATCEHCFRDEYGETNQCIRCGKIDA